MKGINSSARNRRRLTSAVRASMIVLALAGCAACAAVAGKPKPGAVSAPTHREPSVDGSAVGQLQHLIDTHQLTEMRTTYNGSYGTSELFQADKLVYFVTLFHGKTFWRVIHTDSIRDADSIYHTFIGQTEKLAQVDIDAMRLKAGNQYAAQMIAENQQRLQALQQEAVRQQQEAAQVAAQQQQVTQQASALSSSLQSTSSQLDAVKQHIRTLEEQQSNPDLALPTVPANAAPASAPSTGGAPAASSTSH